MSGSMIFAPDWHRSLLLLTLLALVSCGPNEVIVKGQFPAPVMDPLPLRLGVWYGEDFAQHEFYDSSVSREESEWIVSTGEAQVQFWNTLLHGMFSEVVPLDSAPGGDTPLPDTDAILIPHVDELQYALPVHTNIKVYEIWMRYRFELLTSSGEPIAEWTMPAYGKTPTAMLTSKETAVNLAAVVALRDAGAHFAIGFTQVPAVREWLQQRQEGAM